MTSTNLVGSYDYGLVAFSALIAVLVSYTALDLAGTGRADPGSMIAAVEQVSGEKIAYRHGPPKPGEMPAVIVDPSRAHAAGWSPQYPKIADGLVGVWEEWSVTEIEVPAR